MTFISVKNRHRKREILHVADWYAYAAARLRILSLQSGILIGGVNRDIALETGTKSERGERNNIHGLFSRVRARVRNGQRAFIQRVIEPRVKRRLKPCLLRSNWALAIGHARITLSWAARWCSSAAIFFHAPASCNWSSETIEDFPVAKRN